MHGGGTEPEYVQYVLVVSTTLLINITTTFLTNNWAFGEEVGKVTAGVMGVITKPECVQLQRGC